MSQGTVSSSQLGLLKASDPSRAQRSAWTFSPQPRGSASRLAAGAMATGGVFMTAQRELVRRIDRYLIAAGSRPVFIAELCETFKVRGAHCIAPSTTSWGFRRSPICAASGSTMSVLPC